MPVALRLSLVSAFEQVGLGQWTDSVLMWALRFAGIESHADVREIAPARCLMRLARRYARVETRRSDEQVANDLATLAFTRWQARWPAWVTPSGLSERWLPLEQPFGVFARRYPRLEEMLVWESTRPVVFRQSAVEFLMRHRAAVGRVLA
jgi:hypothetical protein